MIFLVLLLLKALISGWSLFLKGTEPFYKGLGLGFIGCTVAMIVNNVFGDRWSYFTLGGYFWILWGLVDRSLLLCREKQTEETDQSIHSAEPMLTAMGT